MEYLYEVKWTPETTLKLTDTINKITENCGFTTKLIATHSIGTHKIISTTEISEEILSKYIVEATKVFEEKLKGKIYLERI